MITDHFYNGPDWEISLKPFAGDLAENEMILVFHPMYQEYEYLPDLNDVPEIGNGGLLRVNDISLTPEYKAVLTFE
jgi:hypothetical protein